MKHCRYLLPLLVILPLLTACDSDDMDEDAIYTFTGHTIYSFCAETPHLQAFADIIQRSGQQTFFELYGHYTTFAPTDEAIDAYLREKGWDYDHLTTEQMLTNGVMGLCGEAGECCDIMKKHLFQGHELNRDKLVDELGDVAWYLAETATAVGADLSEILQMNIDKLRARYPDGFETEKSVCRRADDE